MNQMTHGGRPLWLGTGRYSCSQYLAVYSDEDGKSQAKVRQKYAVAEKDRNIVFPNGV